MKDSITVYGSCVSRDVFNFLGADKYNLELTLGGGINSFCFGGDKIPINKDDISVGSNFDNKMLSYIMDRTALDVLLSHNTKYLVLDLANERFPIQTWQVGEASNTVPVTWESFKLSQKIQDIKVSDWHLPNRSMEEWKEKLKSFLLVIKGRFRPQNIILLSLQLSEYFVDNNEGKIYSFTEAGKEYTDGLDSLEIRKQQNEIIRVAEQIFDEVIPGCWKINLLDGIIANTEHHFGLHPLHYDYLYYEYAAKCLSMILDAQEKKEGSLLQKNGINREMTIIKRAYENKIKDKKLVSDILLKRAKNINDTLKIIDRSPVNDKAEKMRELCRVENILPKCSGDIIKVRIIHWGGAYFLNVIKSIIIAFQKMQMIDLQIIIFHRGANDVKQELENQKIPYTFYDKYNVEKDKPDIMFFTMNNSIWQYKPKDIEKIRANTDVLIGLPLSIVLNEYENVEKYYNELVLPLKKYNVDACILDKLIFSLLNKNNINEDFLVKIGNPKFDSIFNCLNKKTDIPNEWNKLKDKKIVLWLTDHNWRQNSTNVTFDIFAKSIFHFFNSHHELGLIFRPHPVMARDFIEGGIWKQEDLKLLHNYIDNTPNIIWDTLSDYSLSYSLASSILSDLGSGTMLSALATQKPLCILQRTDVKTNICHREIYDCYYKANNQDELFTFFEDVVIKNEDTLKYARKNAFEESISYFDGKNGERIVKYALELLDAKNA